MRALLIDGGQSGCRAAVVDHGRTVATATAAGLPRQGRDYDALRALLADDDWRGIDVVAAGLTGFRGDADAAAAALRVPSAIVTNDAVTAHLGALGGSPGVVVVAGTGAIALAADERAARADGWGTRLGDDGGGYWIGRAGLAAALRAHDGRRGGSPDLLARAVARFGEVPPRDAAPAGGDAAPRRGAELAGGDATPRLDAAPAGGDATPRRGAAPAGGDATPRLDAAPAGGDAAPRRDAAPARDDAATRRPAASAGAIITAVYDSADPVAVIASFARDVADAARDGDAIARGIWEAAGRELAETARAAARRAGVDGPVTYAGGLFDVGDLLLDPFRAELGEVREPLGDALDGAARLLERPPHFLDLIHETGAS